MIRYIWYNLTYLIWYKMISSKINYLNGLIITNYRWTVVKIIKRIFWIRNNEIVIKLR